MRRLWPPCSERADYRVKKSNSTLGMHAISAAPGIFLSFDTTLAGGTAYLRPRGSHTGVLACVSQRTGLQPDSKGGSTARRHMLVKLGTRHSSDNGFHQAHTEANKHQPGWKQIHDKGNDHRKQLPQEPHGKTRDHSRDRPGAIMGPDLSIKPNREDTDEKPHWTNAQKPGRVRTVLFGRAGSNPP